MLYEIKKGEQVVNGIEVETWIREVTSANIFEVEVGTTGYQGGDSGHGGRTYLRIQDLGGTDIDVNVLQDRFRGSEGIVLTLGGDTELATFIEVLEFAVKVLKEQSEE